MSDGSRRIHQQWSILGVWYRLADAICIALGLVLGMRCDLSAMSEHYVIAAAVAIIVYSLLAEMGGMYRSWRGVSAGREIVGVAASWACTVFSLLALALRHEVHGRVLAHFDGDVVPGHAAADRAGRTTTRWIQRLLLRWGYKRNDSPSSASTNWDSNWRGTSRLRPRWG